MSPRSRKTTKILSPEIYRRVCNAVADTLEGMGVREIVAATTTFDAVDAAAVKEAFDQVVRQIRAQGKKHG